jgi:hypothetical protein
MQNQDCKVREPANTPADNIVGQINANHIANNNDDHQLDLGCQTRLEGLKMVRRIAAALAEAGIDVKLKASGSRQMAKLALVVPPEAYQKAQKIIKKTVPQEDFYQSLFG